MGQNPGKSGLHIKILEMYGCSSPEESELQLLIHIELGVRKTGSGFKPCFMTHLLSRMHIQVVRLFVVKNPA